MEMYVYLHHARCVRYLLTGMTGCLHCMDRQETKLQNTMFVTVRAVLFDTRYDNPKLLIRE